MYKNRPRTTAKAIQPAGVKSLRKYPKPLANVVDTRTRPVPMAVKCLQTMVLKNATDTTR
jgi:hypothetical protein